MSNSINTLLTQLKNLGFDPAKLISASVHELFKMPLDSQNSIKSFLLAESFEWHFQNNAYYRKICEEQNIQPGDIQQYSDLSKIPLVPVSKFKSAQSFELLSKPLGEIEHEARSVGTGGIPSVTRRCRRTIDTFLIGIDMMFREFFQISKGAALFMAPSPEEVPEMGLTKILNVLSGHLDTSRYMVKNRTLDSEAAAEQLLTWENQFTRYLIGPPFLILKLIQHLEKKDQKIQLDKRTLIITMGGWKSFTGKVINRNEFAESCRIRLGVEASQIRDIYGLIESNMIAIEDENHVKHTSPFTHLSVRSLDNLNQEASFGEPGVLAILDPLSYSTPGFILTEDVVKLLPSSDSQNRNSQTFQFIGKSSKATEFGCCAVMLEKNMQAQCTQVVQNV